MAEAFLSQLLLVENSVQNDDSQCCICGHDYGSLRPDSGTIECQTRLPCNHSIGSGCISIWLSPTGSAENSCPFCRREFFPAQPRPHGEDDEDDMDELPEFLHAAVCMVSNSYKIRTIASSGRHGVKTSIAFMKETIAGTNVRWRSWMKSLNLRPRFPNAA